MLRALLLIFALAAPGFAADTSPHQSLARADQAQPWHAVGRIDTNNSFCTGAMISPKLVLTAAHCMYDRKAKALRAPDTIKFKAGYRNGRAVAVRTARRFAIYPDYDHEAVNTISTISNDVAVIELESPILIPSVVPFDRIRRPAPHARVTVVSYGEGREEIPALEDGCKIFEERGKVLEFTCSIDSGSSGSPVFVMTDAGMKIASVMSSSGDRTGSAGAREVSIGVTLGPRLDRLVRQLETTNFDPRFVKARTGLTTLQSGNGTSRGRKLPQITR